MVIYAAVMVFVIIKMHMVTYGGILAPIKHGLPTLVLHSVLVSEGVSIIYGMLIDSRPCKMSSMETPQSPFAQITAIAAVLRTPSAALHTRVFSLMLTASFCHPHHP